MYEILLLISWFILSDAWIKDNSKTGSSTKTITASSSCPIQENVLSEIESYMDNDNNDIELVEQEENIKGILQELSKNENGNDISKGKNIYKLINGLASSNTFREEYWHKKPLLIKGDITNNCIQSIFTIENDLKLVGESYITGHRTADTLRNNASSSSSWEFVPLKKDLSRRTTLEEVEEGLKGGTIYFNTAGSLWPSLGALCKLSNIAFGLPSNINIYITPPKISISVPPHTDKQDVFILQTSGSKHWKVYAPPSPRKENVDPLSRGKNNDILTAEELGEPIIDKVIQPGDVLYIPHGFPHTTHTAHDTNNDQTSIHLTLGLDTHVWFLTYAHIRWALLQKTNKPFAIKITNDDLYWKAMDTIPIGFLAQQQGYNWKDILSSFKEEKNNKIKNEYIDYFIENLKSVMIELEPNRWKNDNNNDSDNYNNILPSNEQIKEVITYIITKHLHTLLKVQYDMYTDVNPHSEDTILKAYKGTQDQKLIMEEFALFCGNIAMAQSYATMRKQREDTAARAAAASNTK